MNKDSKTFTTLELLKISSDYLAKAGIPSARLDAEVLLADVLKTDRIRLYVDHGRKLLPHELDLYRNAIGMRRKRVPIAYITGHKEFMSLDLDVCSKVLIPRSDTECLVEYVAEQIRCKDLENPYILDLCTGSGAISCALASIFPSANIISTDISQDACDLASANANKLGFNDRITVLKGDLFDALEASSQEAFDTKENGQCFDCIVSNPPYIPTADVDGLEKDICLYEPRLALDGGEDGMEIVNKILKGCSEYLRCDGIISLEVGDEKQASLASLLMSDIGFFNVSIGKDLSGQVRTISGIFGGKA